MGMTDVGVATAPLWIYLGASNSVIGFTQSFAMISMISIALIPFVSRKFAHKKWLLLITQIPFIGVWAVIGLLLIFGPKMGVDKASLLRLFIVLSVSQMFLYGFTVLPHQEYVAGCIPMSHRGRFAGYSYAIASTLGLGMAFGGKIVLERVERPASLGILFLVSWLICQCGYLLAMFGREKPVPTERVPTPWSRKMLAAAWNDKEYLWVVIIWDMFLAFYWPILSIFLPIYGMRNVGMAITLSAVYMIIRSIVSMVGSPAFGYLTDRFSAKRMFIFWTIFASVNFVPLVILRNSIGVYIAMTGGAFIFVGLPAAANTLVFGIPKPEDRVGHYSLMQLLAGLGGTVGPLILGRACDISFVHALIGVTALTMGLSITSIKALAGLSTNPADYS